MVDFLAQDVFFFLFFVSKITEKAPLLKRYLSLACFFLSKELLLI